MAVHATETKVRHSTGVATTNSTNRYQKYKSVELGDQLLERQHCLIEVEEDESVCKVMLARPVSPLSGTGDRFSNTLHGDNDGDDGDIDDGDDDNDGDVDDGDDVGDVDVDDFNPCTGSLIPGSLILGSFILGCFILWFRFSNPRISHPGTPE